MLIGRTTTMATTVKKATILPTAVINGVIRICRCGSVVEYPCGVGGCAGIRFFSSIVQLFLQTYSAGCEAPEAGRGSPASMYGRSSTNFICGVSLVTVIQILIICTMPERTIIPPKIPRAI